VTLRYTGVLFDLDGLLIDSEPLWQRAEIAEFGALGLPLSAAECARTTGLRIDEVVAYRQRQHPFADPAQVAERIVQRVIELIHEEGALLPGALAALYRFAGQGLPMGLASSSPLSLLQAVLSRFSLQRFFQVVHSAQGEPYGKPHPAVYLSAARLLQVPAPQCLALEDSLNGVIAAKAARMGCIAVPAPADRDDPRFCLADAVLDSLEQLDSDTFEKATFRSP
jgi:sugar-phosphatase